MYLACEKHPSDPKKWVVKEVGGDTKKILAFWRMIFSFDSKIVMILRDPRMVVRSIINDRRRKGIRLSIKDIIIETKNVLKVLLDQLLYLDDPNSYFINYDQLTSDPEKTMKGIFKFLDIEFEDINTRPTIFEENVVVDTSSKRTKRVFKSNRKWYDNLSPRENCSWYLLQDWFILI
ncbi:MAG: sulfotransferase [Candidatus Thermoplasmatota archaeon]